MLGLVQGSIPKVDKLFFRPSLFSLGGTMKGLNSTKMKQSLSSKRLIGKPGRWC